jgi:hypothetical protein
MRINQTLPNRFTECFIGDIHFSGTFYEGLEAGEAITALDVCYIETDGKAYQLDDSMTTKLSQITVIALETLTTGQLGRFLLRGEVSKSTWTLTPGNGVFVPATKGEADESSE